MKNLQTSQNIPTESNAYYDSLFNLPLYPSPAAENREQSLNLTRRIRQAVDAFSPATAVEQLATIPEEEWLRRGEERALALFQAAARHVPAYRDFLEQHNVNPQTITTIKDFKQLPIIDKENYLRAYSLEKLCWYGDMSAIHMISVSSGSSGRPFFWPRGPILEAETALEHELFLTTQFELDRYSTLFVVCFAMGMYVAGPITLNSIQRLGEKGYPVTVITPGYAPDDVLNALPSLASKYDQVILAGYPPYIKEIIDQGVERGIDWKKRRVRLLLAGEGFNESWRTYMAELINSEDPAADFINLYGSADAAILAYETKLSINIRQNIAKNMDAGEKLFHDERLPSLLQYHPEHKFIEEKNGELLITTTGGIPLVRYNIHDKGGVLSKKELQTSGVITPRENKEDWNLPFVYVFGKSDQTVILYGANIYPENIRKALEVKELQNKCSGKMIMYISSDKKNDQRMCIDIECSKTAKPSKLLAEKITKTVLKTLLEVNAEFRVVYKGIGKRAIPIVNIYKYGEEKFHSPRNKHSWAHQHKEG